MKVLVKIGMSSSVQDQYSGELLHLHFSQVLSLQDPHRRPHILNHPQAVIPA